jgi:hypothetical protein
MCRCGQRSNSSTAEQPNYDFIENSLLFRNAMPTGVLSACSQPSSGEMSGTVTLEASPMLIGARITSQPGSHSSALWPMRAERGKAW